MSPYGKIEGERHLHHVAGLKSDQKSRPYAERCLAARKCAAPQGAPSFRLESNLVIQCGSVEFSVSVSTWFLPAGCDAPTRRRSRLQKDGCSEGSSGASGHTADVSTRV